MNPFDFFPVKMCLTTGGARWQQAEREFRTHALHVERFNAVPAIGPHQSFNLGLKSALQKFLDSGAHSLLFLEDDVVFQNMEHFWPALQELPADWDVFYLGCNIRGDAFRISPRIYRITNAWTTHAVAFTRPIVKYFLANVPGESEVMYDNWLGDQLAMFNAYTCKPMCAIQRPGKSLIWNEAVDYSPVFKESEGKLI